MIFQTKFPSGISVLDDLKYIGLRQPRPLIINEYESVDESMIIEGIYTVMDHGYYFESSDNSETDLHKMKFRSRGTAWPLSITLTYYALRPPLLFVMLFMWKRHVIRYDIPYAGVTSLDSPAAREMQEHFKEDFPDWRYHWVPLLTDSPLA